MGFGDGNELTSTVRQTNAGPVVGVAALSNAEYQGLLGMTYRAYIDVALAAGASQWIKFTVPSGYGLELINRDLMPNIAGAEYIIHAGTSGGTVQSAITPFNVNRGITTPCGTVIQLIGTPTTVGSILDVPSFIGEGTNPGQSARPAGTLANEQGFDFYPAGSVIYSRIHNTSTATVSNRIVLRFLFSEIPV